MLAWSDFFCLIFWWYFQQWIMRYKGNYCVFIHPQVWPVAKSSLTLTADGVLTGVGPSPARTIPRWIVRQPTLPDGWQNHWSCKESADAVLFRWKLTKLHSVDISICFLKSLQSCTQELTRPLKHDIFFIPISWRNLKWCLLHRYLLLLQKVTLSQV